MNLATFIYKRTLAARGISCRLWNQLRRLFVKIMNDPSCRLNIHGRILELPLSHTLPLNLRNCPCYDALPARLSNYINEKEGQLRCIDVGANIGDTVAAFFQDESDQFLAIEPADKFNRYLQKNWGQSKNVKILNYICSSSDDTASYDIKGHAGSACIVPSEGGIQMESRSLDAILLEQEYLRDVNLLKIDTDGHDFEVLSGARKTLESQHPSILFECDAFGNKNYIADCLDCLQLIHDQGYEYFLLYDNFGYLMGKYSFSDLSSFKDLLFYQLTSNFHYFDVLVMKTGNLVEFLELERKFFNARIVYEPQINSATTKP